MYILIFYILIFSSFSSRVAAVLNVTVITDPPGPVYQVATWIKFKCIINDVIHQPEYEWYSRCSLIPQYNYIETQYSSPWWSGRVLSTPTSCWDIMYCNVRVGNETGLGWVEFSNVTGIGLTYNGSPVINNTMISVNENGTLAGQLVCYHSNINHEMYWILPNGSSLYASSDLYNVSKGLNINGTVFQFLTLRFNKEANVGSYRCVHDNDIVGVWIVDYEFQSDLSLIEVSTTRMTVLQLFCVFGGYHGNVEWYKNNQLLTNNGQSIYDTVTHLVNKTNMIYVSILTFNDQKDTSIWSDEYNCRFKGLLIQDNDNMTISMSHYFVVNEVGNSFAIPCPLYGLNIMSVGVYVDGQVLIPQQVWNETAEVLVQFQPLRDSDHGRMYSCQGNGDEGMVTFNFTVVAIVDYPSLTISLPTVPVVLSGDPVMLSCIVMETTPGLTDASIVFWIDPYSNVVVHTPPDMNVTHQSLNDLTTRSTVSLAAATTSAAGTYSCVASLTTPAFHIRSLFFSKEELLPVQIATPILSIAVETPLDDGVVYIGSTTLLHCSALINAHVDTPIKVEFEWYRDNNVIYNTSINSTKDIFQYISTLSILAIDETIYNITCNVTAIPVGTGFFVLSSWTETTILTLYPQYPNITVVTAPIVYSVPDVFPYNTFNITCTVSLPIFVTVPINIYWKVNDAVVQYSIANSTVTNTSTTVILYSTDVSNGTYLYQCIVSIGNYNKEFYSNSTVTVRGFVHPLSPINLSVSTKHSQEVTITWMVTMVTYTPEKYTIIYGTRPHQLQESSLVVNSNNDITLIDQMYHVTLTGLHGNTTYYYKLVTSNNYSTVHSVLYEFTTPPSSFNGLTINSSDNVSIGTNQSLSCIVNVTSPALSPPIEISFVTPDGSLLSSTGNVSVVTVSDTITSGSVHFIGFRASSAGLYTCNVILSNGERAAVTKYIIVNIPPPELSISFHQSTPTTVYIGHNVTLVCMLNLSPYMDINVTIATVWKLGGTEVVPSYSTARWLSSFEYEVEISLLNVDKEDAGLYECNIGISGNNVVPVNSSAYFYLIVRDLPSTHNITISTTNEDRPTVGSRLTIYCTVITLLANVTVDTMRWINPMGQYIATNTTDYIIIANDTVLTLIIPVFKTSLAGSYTCLVMSHLHSLGLVKTTKLEHLIISTIPPPTLIITPSHVTHVLAAGTYFNLSCSGVLSSAVDTGVYVSITWKRNGVTLPIDNHNTTRIETTETQHDNGSYTYSNVLVFHSLSRLIDNGTYTCLMLVTSSPFSNVIQPTFASTDTSIYITSPPLSVSIYPVHTVILDTSPYNTFNITCEALTSPDIVSSMSFYWRVLHVGTNDLGTKLTNGTHTILYIDEQQHMNGFSKSVLYTQQDTYGMYHYMCEVILNIPQDIQQTVSNKTEVLVKGPKLPHAISDVSIARGTGVDTANITWSVNAISYTPEMYLVQYGTNPRNLVEKTTAIEGPKDWSLLNVKFNITITNLLVGETYYYQIVSTNSEGSTVSERYQFIAGFDNSLFQIKLSGLHDCHEWVFTDISTKRTDIINNIIKSIEEQCNGGCHLPAANINDGHFICFNSKEVIFRGRVYGTPYHAPSSYVQFLEQWITQNTRKIVVGGILLTTDRFCNVSIESLSDPVCSVSPSVSVGGILPGNTMYLAIGSGVGGVVLVCFFLILVCCCIVCKIKKDKRKKETVNEFPMKEKECYDSTHATPTTPISPLPHLGKSLPQLPTYMSPSTGRATSTRFPYLTPPPQYMSPRSSRADGTLEKTADHTHIYYLNTPPPVPHPPQVDPIYEPIPEGGAPMMPKLSPAPPLPPFNQSATPTPPPSAPPPPPSGAIPPPAAVRHRSNQRRSATASGRSPLRLVHIKEGVSPPPTPTRATKAAEKPAKKGADDDSSSSDDYEYMTSAGHIDFSSATI